MTAERTWWVETRRNSESDFDPAKTKHGFYATLPETQAQAEAKAAELNRLLGWDKYRVAVA